MAMLGAWPLSPFFLGDAGRQGEASHCRDLQAVFHDGLL